MLAAYLGLRRPRHIAGLLQHGWTLASPVETHFVDFPKVGRNDGYRLFVWSHTSRAWRPQDEHRTTYSLGAPWAYLACTRAQHALMKPPEDRSLIFPVHGTRLVEVDGDQASLASAYRRSEGPSTACLHADDVSRPGLVQAWAAQGHTVVTAGARHDPLFLARIFGLIARHRRVISNRLSTSVLYAASVGRHVAVYGQTMNLGGFDHAEPGDAESRWPEFFGTSTDLAAVQATARSELGFDQVLPRDALQQVLGWSRHSGGPAARYWVGSPSRKAGNVLGLTHRTPGDDAQHLSQMRPSAWLKHPLSHLPRRLPTVVPDLDRLPEPIFVTPD